MKRSFLCLFAWLSLVVGPVPAWLDAASAQEDEESARVVLSQSLGSTQLGARRVALPYSRTPMGVVVALQPVVDLLDVELEVGPLGKSHTLRVGGAVARFGPDSSVLLLDDEIVRLTQAPLAATAGLQVPLDLLRRSLGELAGVQFLWNEDAARLHLRTGQGRAHRVSVDKVHTGGVTTLVLLFPERPLYRLERSEQRLDVRMVRGSVEGPRGMRLDDPLVRAVDVSGERVRIQLAPGVTTAEPYVLGRAPRVQLVFDFTREQATSLSTAARPRPDLRYADEGLKIVIDPGHGGVESGAVGRQGTLEKDLTLALGRRLAARLRRTLGARVFLTRDGDATLDLESRTAFANQHRADLFVSLHMNSAPAGVSGQGAETYFLDLNASDRDAAAAAEFENQQSESQPAESQQPTPTPVNDPELELMLWDLAHSEHLARSQRLARRIQEDFNETLGLRNRGVKQAPFRVLMGATMPAVLVELGFINNTEEEQRLLDPAYQSRLVESLARSIGSYVAVTEQGELP